MREESKDLELFLDWFSLQSKEVQKNSKIVNAKEFGQSYMLHIDKNTPKVFIPMMPSTAASSENAHCARITVAPHLFGCMFGYARLENDFLDSEVKASNKKDPYRGGYDICILEFEHCLRPNGKLVYDAMRSDEHWLVSYRPDLIQYKPKAIGKLFTTEINFKKTQKDKPATTSYTAYVKHDLAGGIRFTPNILLDPGCYKLHWTDSAPGQWGEKQDYSDFFAISCSEAEYQKEKQLSAALLAFEDAKIERPKWANVSW